MALYRLLISVFALWQGLRLISRGAFAALNARLGHGSPRQPGPHIWLHAASNGELTSARPVIEALRAARPDLQLFVTCNSDTGVTLARNWGLEAQLAPFDLAWIVRRVLKRWTVVAHVTMEAEIWPNRVLSCPGPVIVLGGRLTAGSAKSWVRAGGLAARVLGKVTFLSAQDAESAERFLALGLSGAALGPVVDLKALYTPPEGQDPDAQWRDSFARDSTWLAASTHEGDEETVIAAHLEARRHWPDLRLILAPRHPRRAGEIRRMLDAAGLDCAQRSEGGMRGKVLLADTLGEMARWYALAGIVFIGGTLSDRGGHTPYEPATFGAALIHGPDVANFRAAFDRLRRAGATCEVTDARGLTRALLTLKDPQTRCQLGLAAQKALAQDTDLAGLMARVLPVLPKV